MSRHWRDFFFQSLKRFHNDHLILDPLILEWRLGGQVRRAAITTTPRRNAWRATDSSARAGGRRKGATWKSPRFSSGENRATAWGKTAHILKICCLPRKEGAKVRKNSSMFCIFLIASACKDKRLYISMFLRNLDENSRLLTSLYWVLKAIWVLFVSLRSPYLLSIDLQPLLTKFWLIFLIY